jgi:hypothetical protein
MEVRNITLSRSRNSEPIQYGIDMPMVIPAMMIKKPRKLFRLTTLVDQKAGTALEKALGKQLSQALTRDVQKILLPIE